MLTPEQRAWNNYMPSGQRGWKKPKLTTAQREEIIRRLGEGEKPMDLAAEYGVSGGTIRGLRQYVRPA
jgi:DNA-binding NarL/FixJ family response regulator